MKNLLTITFLLIATAAFAIGNYTTNDELFVHAPSGLKLRNVADGETVLATVPFGAKLKVLEPRKITSPKTVDGLKGYWAKVSYEGKTGYIFDGYLSFLPTPAAGCASLYDYCKKYFKVVSDSLTQSISCDEEVTDENAIQLFSFGGRKVVFTANRGYEWGGESISIQGLSLEEGYLLAKTLYKDDFDSSLKYYKEHPEQATSSNGGVVDIEKYSLFKPGELPNHCFFVEFQSECSDELEVVQRSNVVFIHRWGGC